MLSRNCIIGIVSRVTSVNQNYRFYQTCSRFPCQSRYQQQKQYNTIQNNNTIQQKSNLESATDITLFSTTFQLIVTNQVVIRLENIFSL